MIERAVMTWLVNAVWVVPVIAATTALCTGFGRFAPRERHGAWMAAMVLAIGLPAAPAAVLPAAPTSLAHSAAVNLAAGIPAATAPPVDTLPLLAFDQAWTRAFLCLAGAVAAIAALRLLAAICAGRGLIRAAKPHDIDPAVRRVLSRASARYACALPPILESGAIASPVVVGAMRPVILVPPGFGALAWDEQRAALLHEMAHVARRDYVWNLVCEVSSLPLAWHPAIRVIKAGLRRSREAACDAMAAEAMDSPVAYARSLVSLVGRLGAVQPNGPLAVGLIGKSDLEERLTTLLAPRQGRVSSRVRMAAAAVVASAVLAPVAFLRVTPAFADEPVIARRILVAPTVTPGPAASPAARAAPASLTPIARPARKPPAVGVRPMALMEVPPPPPPPPFLARPPAPPPAPAAPRAPPAPPPPPAPFHGVQIQEHVADGRYEVIVRGALPRLAGVEKAVVSDTLRGALAQIQAHEQQMVRADQARLHAEMAAMMAELDHVRIEAEADQVRLRLRSSEVRQAMSAAAAEAAKAAAEARAADARN
jgi:beta-lactamase regulating signal transducer with metallopeptidase domain